MDMQTQDMQAQDTTDEAGATRRRVLIASSASVLGVATLAACSGGSDDEAATAPPASSASGGGLATQESVHVEVVAVDEIPTGGAAAKSVNGLNVLVTRPAADQVKVFSSVCPHQGCQVAPNGTTNLNCPCHGSTFNIATGARLGGPAPTGLPEYPSTIENGTVFLTSTSARVAD